MTVSSLAALFGALLVLAAAPSVSVLLVTTKAATSGFAHGASTAAGVVAGDLLFILVAVFGLALLIEAVEGTWSLLKYVAAGYLVWLAASFWQSRNEQPHVRMQPQPTSLQGSFMAGLLLTLADQKAVLFYLAFLPAFMDLAALSWLDIGALMAVAIVAVGGVKLTYAYAAERAAALVTPTFQRTVHVVVTGALLAAAVAVMLRA